jgi:chromosome segregation ATPase
MTDDRPTIDRDALRALAMRRDDEGTGVLTIRTNEALALLDALDAETRRVNAETRRADAALGDLRLATEQGDRYLAASKAASRERWDDLLAERAGLSRHLEDSQAEVARLRDACEGWESLAHAAEEREDERARLTTERDAETRRADAATFRAETAWQHYDEQVSDNAVLDAERDAARAERDSLAERIAAVRALHRSHASPEEAQEFMEALGLL